MEDKKAPDAFFSSSSRPLRRPSDAAASSSSIISACRKRKTDQDDGLVKSDHELLQIKRIRSCNNKLSKLGETSKRCLQFHDRMERLKKVTLLLMAELEGMKQEEEHCRRNLDAFLREFDAVAAATTADTSFASHRPGGGGSDEDRCIQAIGWCSSPFYSAHRKRLAELDEIYHRCVRCHDHAAQLKKKQLFTMAQLKGMRQEKERCRLLLDAYLREFEAVATAVPSLIDEDEDNQEDDDYHYRPSTPTESSDSYKYSPATPTTLNNESDTRRISLLPVKKRGFHWH